MSDMKRWISLGFGLILLWPTLLFAQSGLSLTPPNSDLSLIYLSNMFGVVDGVLFGTGSQLLGTLFGVFNGTILILGGIIIVYTFFIGTLKTAHEGEILGKEWSSVWIPLRVVAGITLLIPKASGYSFIQIFMMWIIVQGIGVADSVWNAALDYLYSGGIVISQNYTSANGQSVTTFPMVSLSAKLLRSLTCVEMLKEQVTRYRTYQIQKGLPVLDPVPDFTTDIITAINASSVDSQHSVQFPQSNYYNTNGVCGTVGWHDVSGDLPDALKKNDQFMASWQNDKSRSKALTATVSALQPAAKTIADNYSNRSINPLAAIPLGQMNGSKWGGPNNGPFLIKGSILGDSAASYYGIMSTTMRLISQNANSSSYDASWTQEAKVKGWALAGAYYFNIVNANSQVASITDGNIPQMTDEAPFDVTTTDGITGILGGKASSYVNQLQMLINGKDASTSNSNPSAKDDYIVATASLFISDAVRYATGLTYGSSNVQGGKNVAPAAAVGGGISGFLSGIANSQNTNANPVIELAKFGNSLVVISFVAILLMAIIGFGATIGLGAIPFCSVGAAGISIVTSLTAFFTPIFVSLIAIGLTMSYYIPMIPFIIFSFGVVGWFIAVAEAMLAAPLVALGISHPEGSHAVLGKADPAVGHMVNVFLRPTLMIFGLMVSYVGVWLLNQGFGQAFAGATEKTNGSLASAIFKPIASIFIYVMIVIQIVQKSFSLIHIIPDQVLRWIGINIQGSGGEAEAEATIGAGAKSGMSKTAGTVGGAASLGTSAGKGGGGMIKGGIEASSSAKPGTADGAQGEK
jgi:defect-in-organelle-trafficking protein DotA